MTKQTILILGSGGLRIGQAGEFDYSGSQAIKAVKEEGCCTVLVNPNIATVQTDEGLADQVYLQPLQHDIVAKIVEKERPQGILLSFGGQTALNLGIELWRSGVLKKHGVKVLGTPVDTILTTEDRQLFKECLNEIDVKTPRSFAVDSVSGALDAAGRIGYPLMMRSGYSLGGLGSGKIEDEKQLIDRVREALCHAPQLLIEEYLYGWKEIEYEVMRDCNGNAITICNMENFDPMGIHTGESIVVAPSQTLTNQEYHFLRSVALKTVRKLGVVGECNIQYALNPENGDYRVIEVNARLSRSSALASKATGYPIAFVAAKLALGKRLDELRNQVTQETSAFFEPALDYIVVKMPRWDIQKFKSADRRIGSEMKSVGEVMGIGRTFPEALQKAVRMLSVGQTGLHDYPRPIPSLKDEIVNATDRRLFAIYQYLRKGKTVDEVHALSKINPWFLHHLKSLVDMEKKIAQNQLEEGVLRDAKRLGFSDAAIAHFKKMDEASVRKLRQDMGITPFIKQIDTLAGEFAAQTNYLYLTYNGGAHDVEPSEKPPVIILGSGPYCIGSSVEFDWCAVNALKSFRKIGESPIMINSNPETVSTDYDESERLYFEELSLERVSDIADFENPKSIMISVGGQAANNLASPLSGSGYPILGTPTDMIDRAENRMEFSSLLGRLEIDQPTWDEVKSLAQAKNFAKKVGYPILVRPSFVLSGAAMNVVHSEDELESYLSEAALVSRGHPVVISQFISNGKELEIDGVAQNGNIVVHAITEHVENAGVHSGDATVVIPPQRLYLETIRRAKQIVRKIAKALNITGPFNIQFIAKENGLKVIECNARASRSFPFVSKVTNQNFIDIAVRAMMGHSLPKWYETLELEHVGVKTPQFSYNRLKGANPVAQVEMASTGEVACLGQNLYEAFYHSWMATGQRVEGKRILVSIGGDKKGRFLDVLKSLEASGWQLYATENTHDYLVRHGVASRFLYKASDSLEPNIKTTIANREVDLIVNIPTNISPKIITDGFTIRRLAIDHNIPLITNMQIALLFLYCLQELDIDKIPIKSWKEYVSHNV
jgi:carbamoyl-phosphate synthase large subunit